MGFAGFVTGGLVPAVGGALKGVNERARMAEEQRRYNTQQAGIESQRKWQQQQAIEAAQRQAAMDELTRTVQMGNLKLGAERNAIEANQASPEAITNDLLVDGKPMMAAIPRGGQPRILGPAYHPPPSTGGNSSRSVSQLRREFNGFVKPYEGLAQAFRKIHGAANDPSAAGDLSLIFGYMKILDPTSVVRESEQASAANARGVPEGVRATWNRVLNGERLSPAQRADFVRQAGNLMQSQRAALTSQINRYRAIAEANDINPDQVVYDPFDNVDYNLSGQPRGEGAATPNAPADGGDPVDAAYQRWLQKQGQ